MTAPLGRVPLTDEQLEEIERRVSAATEGPWSAADEHGLIEGATPAWCISRMRPGYEGMSETGGYLYDVAEIVHDDARSPADAEFIAHARDDVPALIAELRASRAREAETRAHADEWQRRFIAASDLADRQQAFREDAEAERDALAAELSVLRPALREAKGRIDRALVVIGAGREAADGITSVDFLIQSMLGRVRAALTGTEDTPMASSFAVHKAPRRGETTVPCCGQEVADLPDRHTLTEHAQLVTCAAFGRADGEKRGHA